MTETRETRESLLDYLAVHHGPGIADVARRFIDGEIEVRVHEPVPEVVGCAPVVGPPVPRYELERRRYLAQRAAVNRSIAAADTSA